MKRMIALISSTIMLATPLAAQSFRAENRVQVTGVAGGFAVSSGGGHGARGMWCAASDYASRVLGARGTQRIYVGQPISGRTVVFTLDPAGLTPTSATIIGTSVRKAGASLSVDHAHIFCADSRLTNR